MKEFMMLFHHQPDKEQPSPEQLQAMLAKWDNWLGGIAAQNKLGGTNALGFEGRTINAEGLVTDGPYTELKEIVGGYTIVTADNIEEAVKMAEGCPVLAEGGKVEVRDIMIFDK